MRTSIGQHVRRTTRGIGPAFRTAVLLVLLMLLLCWVTRPDLSSKPVPPSEEEVRKVEALRDSSFDRAKPLVLVTRLSPFGYPVVPHIAKSWTVSENS